MYFKFPNMLFETFDNQYNGAVVKRWLFQKEINYVAKAMHKSISVAGKGSQHQRMCQPHLTPIQPPTPQKPHEMNKIVPGNVY